MGKKSITVLAILMFFAVSFCVIYLNSDSSSSSTETVVLENSNQPQTEFKNDITKDINKNKRKEINSLESKSKSKIGEITITPEFKQEQIIKNQAETGNTSNDSSLEVILKNENPALKINELELSLSNKESNINNNNKESFELRNERISTSLNASENRRDSNPEMLTEPNKNALEYTENLSENKIIAGNKFDNKTSSTVQSNTKDESDANVPELKADKSSISIKTIKTNVEPLSFVPNNNDSKLLNVEQNNMINYNDKEQKKENEKDKMIQNMDNIIEDNKDNERKIDNTNTLAIIQNDTANQVIAPLEKSTSNDSEPQKQKVNTNENKVEKTSNDQETQAPITVSLTIPNVNEQNIEKLNEATVEYKKRVDEIIEETNKNKVERENSENSSASAKNLA